MHDRDTKFTASFDGILKSAGMKVMRSPYRSPNTVAFVERFIQTLQQECLDDFIVFGRRHMDHLVSEMVAYYHAERPHQSKENNPLVSTTSSGESEAGESRKPAERKPDVVPIAGIECRTRLGGLLKHYVRKAA